MVRRGGVRGWRGGAEEAGVGREGKKGWQGEEEEARMLRGGSGMWLGFDVKHDLSHPLVDKRSKMNGVFGP
jgi:hypothetical protein